ncbi:MAG: MarR family winged helix-turn-helix transcriptional regulator [Armatimonadota bacterium]
MRASAHVCAREVLETIPPTMWAIRAHMRSHHALNLSVPQFRTLMFLHRHEGTSLSDAAEHLELALPSVSKLIDGLVVRGVVARSHHTGDRRRVTLALTPAGRQILQLAREAAHAYLAGMLAPLPPPERAALARGMRALRIALKPDQAQRAKAG